MTNWVAQGWDVAKVPDSPASPAAAMSKQTDSSKGRRDKRRKCLMTEDSGIMAILWHQQHPQRGRMIKPSQRVFHVFDVCVNTHGIDYYQLLQVTQGSHNQIYLRMRVLKIIFQKQFEGQVLGVRW
jgi:hypothetical protein